MQQLDEKLYSENNSTPSERTEHPKKQARFSQNDAVKAFAKFKNLLKSKLNKRTLVKIGIVAVILICAVVGIRYATNNYMTPIRATEKLENQKSVSVKKYLKTGFKNMGAKNAGEIVNILYESDDFLDVMDELQEYFEEDYERKLDAYGDDFKVTYVVEDKIKLEKTDLRNYQKQFRQYVKYMEEDLEDVKDYTSSDWGDFADELGLTRTQAKKLVNALTDMVDDIGRLEVTAGYELDVLRSATGNMLDDPLETNMTVRVVKVNGLWISVSDFTTILDMF